MARRGKPYGLPSLVVSFGVALPFAYPAFAGRVDHFVARGLSAGILGDDPLPPVF